MNIDENSGSTVLRHDLKYKPHRSLSTWLIGRPLATADAPEQTIGKAIGLAVFSSDALSSVAYAPQEMLIILAAAGMGAFYISVPLALAICGLLVILTLSYEQTIHAYPGGGGAYIVARDNLGELPAQTAAAALLTDYILTVAVSVSSGVAQIVSAFPKLYEYRVEIGVGLVLLVMLINLARGKRIRVCFCHPNIFFPWNNGYYHPLRPFSVFYRLAWSGGGCSPGYPGTSFHITTNHLVLNPQGICQWNNGVNRCRSYFQWHYCL